MHVDVGFRAHRGANGPEIDVRQRPVSDFADAGLCRCIFDDDVVVGGFIAEAANGGEEGFARSLEFAFVTEFIVVNFGDVFQIVLCLGCESEGDSIGRARGLVIDHVEIVVVHAGVNRLGTRIPK